MLSKDYLYIASVRFVDKMLLEFKAKQKAMNSTHCSKSHVCHDSVNVCLFLPLHLMDSVYNSSVVPTVISDHTSFHRLYVLYYFVAGI